MTTFLDLLREDKKITFFLGAGASRSAGFPTDTELRDIVADYMLNANIVGLFEVAGFSKEKCEEFRKKLIRGGYSTIDELINSFTEYAPIGKMAISRCILASEDLSNSDDFFSHKHWYMPFFLTIFREGLIDKLDNISFITLNYDRSLQHFLNEFSTNRDITHRPKILHLHGRLPLLEFESPEGKESLPYGRYNLDGISLHAHSSSISSLADIQEDNKHYAQAKGIINQTQYLFILGFGFHKTILEKLDLTKNLRRNLKVYSLSVGLKQAQIDLFPDFNFYRNDILCTHFANNISLDIEDNIFQYAQNDKSPSSLPRKTISDYDPFDENHYDPFHNT